jgi:hypothetical protein
MGYVQALGHCILCQSVFSFNPVHVPSLRVAGKREPICLACITSKVNPFRESKGLEPVVPRPDAYEAIPEEELSESTEKH